MHTKRLWLVLGVTGRFLGELGEIVGTSNLLKLVRRNHTVKMHAKRLSLGPSWGSLVPPWDHLGAILGRLGAVLEHLGGISGASRGASFRRRSDDTREERFDRACAVKTPLVKICDKAEGRFKRAGAVKRALATRADFRERRFDRACAVKTPLGWRADALWRAIQERSRDD